MSWIEDLKSNLIITTGDGKQYRPLWMNATKAIEYNIAEFEFPNVSGTRVNRGLRKGAKYNLEICFQGEDCIEQALLFERSADDIRPWVVSHPLYGNLTVQPVGLLFDNSKYNVSKITGTVIETITDDNPKSTIIPVDKIAEDKISVDVALAESFANDVVPNSTDITNLTSSTNSMYSAGQKKVKSLSQAEEYFNLFNKANSAILVATSYPLEAIQAIQAVINYPSQFEESVQTRIQLLEDQFNTLRDSLSTITTKAEKKIFESQGGTLISNMAVTSSTPLTGDYANKTAVLTVVETILDNYNNLIADLDSLQTENGGSIESYIPDASSLMKLNSLISFTLSNLFNIALNAKQERAIILENDSNVILLTHRFYGLDIEDEKIDEFILNNNIGLTELLQIKKGRKIIYYV